MIYEKYKNIFQKEYLKDQFSNSKILDKEEVRKAIRVAYGTASRTFSGIRERQVAERKITFDNLLIDLERYFSSADCASQTEFNTEWKKFYESVVKDFDGVYKPNCGQCQKIINVTFKILSCFFDYSQYKSKFNFCHMILDGYTLNWYHNHCKTVGQEDRLKKIVWSKLSKNQYFEIQNNIADWFKHEVDYNIVRLPQTAFEAEFLIWRQEMLREGITDAIKTLLTLNEADFDFSYSYLTNEEIYTARDNLEEL